MKNSILILGSKPPGKIPKVEVQEVFSSNGSAELANLYIKKVKQVGQYNVSRWAAYICQWKRSCSFTFQDLRPCEDSISVRIYPNIRLSNICKFIFYTSTTLFIIKNILIKPLHLHIHIFTDYPFLFIIAFITARISWL